MEYKAEKILKLHENKNDKNLDNAKYHIILEILKSKMPNKCARDLCIFLQRRLEWRMGDS